ncbi:MAG: iron-sulfur binding hydrogenase [Candidatus Cryosericum sp.]|jgi:hypothetical protein
MTVQDIADALKGSVAVQGDASLEVTSGYVCDLLSEVIAKAVHGTAWATIQTHVNVVAVAAMIGVSVVIVCEGRSFEPTALERAREEHITILYSQDSAFVVSGKLYSLGLR